MIGPMSVRAGEGAAVAWSAGFFFFALSAYYLLRPLRDEMGVAGGSARLPWLFTATFLVMLAAVPLYSWVVARVGRDVFVPLVYRFSAAVLVGFYVWLSRATGDELVWAARAFFVWTAVFNLLVVSVFWELMADLWRRDQGERLFGKIAAGGSAGALVGPFLTATLAPRIGAAALALVAALLLEAALLCRRGIARTLVGARSQARADASEESAPIGGGALAAFALIVRTPRIFGLAAWVLLLAGTGTFAYLEQARIVEASLPDPIARTVLFARIDLVIGAISVAVQGLAVGRLVPRIGVGWTLAILPLLSLVGFSCLALWPTLTALAAFQVVRRAADFSLAKPAREVLFTTLGREAKYKAKHLIDTAIYRGGDLASAWAFHGLVGAGLGASWLAGLAALACAPWAALSLRLGRAREGAGQGS